ncbi:YkgJ family cysteine cluster protein [Hydrogenophaga sp. 5NK40-0174]|uniref:YkgJ family cysteine cluster protein n=1 Tax=Hydrogenophaga sp. 5NK40-0174 TaxID=3127649 RepID=UPI00310C7C2B
MLNKEERDQFEASVQRVRQAVLRRVAPLPRAEARRISREQLYQGLALVFDQALQADTLPPACESGCSACCHQAVSVTPMEAEALVGFIRMHWSAEAAQQMRQAAEARASNDSPSLSWAERPPCVLLGEDHRCRAYEARPAACRKCHSLSRVACDAREDELPQNLKLLMDAEALMGGVRLALEDCGDEQPVQTLPKALLKAWRAAEA